MASSARIKIGARSLDMERMEGSAARRRKRRTIQLDGRQALGEILEATQPSLPTADSRTPRMMAFDRTPSSPTLDADTLSALRSSFGRSISDGSHPAELRDL